MKSIDPPWVGNEVWCVVFVGATLTAFPNAYVAAFSGVCLGFMLLLCCLVFRGATLEFRSERPFPGNGEPECPSSPRPPDWPTGPALDSINH
jgi:cytochrome bd-type quinol oxidase subunit 2